MRRKSRSRGVEESRSAVIVFALAVMLAVVGNLASLRGQVAAQGGETQRAFVYGINAAIPDNYVGTFAPPAAEAIYLLAGETSVISPRYTEIAFWPITNEFRPNWSGLNKPVPGTLEVLSNGSVVAAIAATDYTIHFEQEGGITTAEIFLGEDAIAAHERFQARQAAFQQAADEYFAAERAWQEAAAAAEERRQAGESVEVPPAPTRPDPIGIFSNGLNQGMPIALEPGQYTIRLRGTDGVTVADSERALTVFAPRRSAAGYTVVPETRWTTPDESPGPDDVILGEANSTLYLEPRVAREYPARAWALLQDPQRSAGDAGDWIWINGERLDDARLDVVVDGAVVDERVLTPYQVDQLPGSQLGYDVVEIVAGADNASAAPDFEAYPIQLGAVGQQYEIRLVSEAGEILAGSARQVRVPTSPDLTRLLLLPIVPLAIGAAVITRRQRRVTLPPAVTG